MVTHTASFSVRILTPLYCMGFLLGNSDALYKPSKGCGERPTRHPFVGVHSPSDTAADPIPVMGHFCHISGVHSPSLPTSDLNVKGHLLGVGEHYPDYCCPLKPSRCSSAALVVQTAPFHLGIQVLLSCRNKIQVAMPAAASVQFLMLFFHVKTMINKAVTPLVN